LAFPDVTEYQLTEFVRILESQRELYNFLKVKPDAVIPLEIGGGNGLQSLVIGASTALDIPAIDGDWMGRAYPVSWQTTPVVFEKKAMMIPTCISDGNGRIMVSPIHKDDKSWAGR
jgi:DUF917 family protein